MSIFLPAQDEQVARRRRRLLSISIVVVAIIGLAARPGYRQFKKLRTQKLVAQAEACLNQNRPAEALDAGKAALSSGAEGPRIFAVMLKIFGAAGSPDAFYFWSKLAEISEINLEHRRELVNWAVAWGQLERAEQQWRLLYKAHPQELETFRAGAALYEVRGESKRAVELAQRALRKAPDDVETRILLGRVLSRSDGPNDRSIGKRLLLEQAQRPDAKGLYVLRLLSEMNVVSSFEATDCATWLTRHPLREDRDSLTAASFSWQITPYKRASIVAETAAAIKNFDKGIQAEIDLARWLARHGEHEAIVKLFSESIAAANKEIFSVYLDALGAIGRWADVDKMLNGPSVPIEPLAAALYAAKAADRQGNGRVAELRWKQALDISAKDPRSLARVADYARRSGNVAVTEAACERLIAQNGPIRRSGYRELLALHGNNLLRATEVLERYLKDFPDDIGAENDLAYSALLLGKDADALIGTAERLVRQNPDLAAYRTTLALAQLRLGKPEEARHTMVIRDDQWIELRPYQQAVFAASLGQMGQSDRTKGICAAIDLSKLRIEERRLIEKWL